MKLTGLSLALLASWLVAANSQQPARSNMRTAHAQMQSKARMSALASRSRREPPRDCSDAPNADLKSTCKMIRHMDHVARRRVARQAQFGNSIIEDTRRNGAPNWQQPIPLPPNSRGHAAYHPYDCMTLICLCPFFRGTVQNGNCILASGQPLTMAYRKEYRMMTDDERNRWHNALNVLKRNGEYDRLSAEHLSVGIGSGAHSGPGFLPWHREYLKRVEIALRLVDPGIAIPYWDSVMDWYLPDARDSIMFSNMFAGESDWWGNVVQGPFAYWRTLEGRATINRQLARKGRLFDEQQINNIVAQNAIEFTLAYTAPVWGCPYGNNYGAIEYTHSNIHLWIGGDMEPPSTSANEPIFFMHHSFVDYLWELWRQLKQPRWLREQAYAPDHYSCANQQHFRNAIMRPFPYLLNADGLHNGYTDQMYRYAPRATCSIQNPSCGSPYLFCDTRGFPHCVAKIKPGGNCQGFEMFNACYRGRCWFGRCQQVMAHAAKTLHVGGNQTMMVMRQRAQEENAMVKKVKPTMAAPLFVDCFNRHECCESWELFNGCDAQPEYMSVYCQATCGLCAPSYNKTDDCTDRHPHCPAFERMGHCKNQYAAPWMMENCRSTCGMCQHAKSATCLPHGKPVPIPVTPKLIQQISGSDEPEVVKRLAAVRRRRV
ncbi:unnamed protein product, partial [Mesorhabditis spiculigera]